MTQGWRPWLPEGALSGGRVERMLDALFGQWSDKWLAGSSLHALAGLASSGAIELAQHGDAEWHYSDHGVAVSLPETGRTALAEMMLEVAIDGASMTVADRQVVERLVAGSIDDLCARLGQMLKLPGESRWRTGRAGALHWDEARVWDFGIDDREPLIRLFIEDHLLVGMVKASLPPVQAAAPLKSVVTGLADQPVSVSALLGRCQLSLSELADVSEGDVLVLDRALGEPLELALDGQVKVHGCTVEQEGEQLCLKLLTPISG